MRKRLIVQFVVKNGNTRTMCGGMAYRGAGAAGLAMAPDG
jgi:hypothetical protein